VRLFKSLAYQLIELVKTLKENGGQAGLAKLGKIVRRIFYVRRDRWVFALTLSEKVTTAKPRAGLVIQQVKDKDELAPLAALAGPTDMVRFRRMIETGCLAFIAWQDGQVAGWGWISDRIDPQTNRTQAPLRRGDACLYDLFVAPAYRDGYKRSVISCAKDDLPPLIVAEKVGYVAIGESYHSRFLFWERFEYRPFESEEKYYQQTIIPLDEVSH
jgi:hypothetical protein